MDLYKVKDHQEATCKIWKIVIISLNIDCLWTRMERNSILAHRQSTFKEIITVCHIVYVGS
jgi:hypothetical protein